MTTPASGPRIAIAYASPRPDTFVQAHMERLPGVVLVLGDGLPPNRLENGGLIMHGSGAGRIMDVASGALRGLLPQKEHSRRIAQLLKEREAQVVLAEFGYTAMYMLDACRMAGVPLVAHFHGIDAHSRDYLRKYHRYQQLFKEGAAFVAVSRSMRDHLIQLGAPAERTHHTVYGVDLERFTGAKPAQAPPNLLAIGRFVEKKAPHLTILAFSKVLERLPEARLTMVGDGRLWEACDSMVRALGLGDRIHLAGHSPHDGILPYLRTSRAFVQHSVTAHNGDSEGTPVAILEAMASGLPVIATRHAGIPDVVEHGVHGLLCDELDITTMAASMERLLSDPMLAATMGAQAASYARRTFPMEQQIAALHTVLRQAVSYQRSGT